jgi:hypothetical protein
MNVTLLQEVQASVIRHTLIPFKIDLGFTLAHAVSVDNKLCILYKQLIGALRFKEWHIALKEGR